MISWKTLRTFCLVLLLIPVIHLVYLVSRDTVATLDSSPDAWAAEIDAYARKDRRTKDRDPVTLRYVAQLFEAVGTDHVLALDAHHGGALGALEPR